MYDLNELLTEVLDKYYDITGYNRPTISWSKEYMFSRFGQYDYHINHISISRFLCTNDISKEALISVILHEIIHQQEVDHNAKFKRLFSNMPQYHDYNFELEEYFETIELPYLTQPKNYCNSEKVAYCLLPEEYKNNITTCDERTFIDIKNKNIYYIDDTLKGVFIIYLLEDEGMYKLIGWSTDSIVYKNRKEIKSKRFGGLDFHFNIQTTPDNCFFLPEYFSLLDISQKNLPSTFSKDRIYIVDIEKDDNIKLVLKDINEYPSEFHGVGLHNAAIDCIAPLKVTNIKELISMSKKERKNDYMRSLWIANLAVKIDKNFETILSRADARLFSSLYRLAAEDYILAYEMNPLDTYSIIGAIKSLTLYDNLEKASNYIMMLEKVEFDFTKDIELKNCKEYIKCSHRGHCLFCFG